MKLFDVGMMSDGRVAHHCHGQAVGRYAQAGTFSEHILCSENSLVKVDQDLPFHALAVVSCGVATGVGSVTERAGTRPGDSVAVVGVGGIGMNAVQGARLAGATLVVGIDPIEIKRTKAMEFGATHTFQSIEEACLAVPDLTSGVMCDRVVLSPGVVHGDMIESCLSLTAKGGTLVVTGSSPLLEQDVKLNLFALSMLNKEVKGTIFGSSNPRVAIPRLLAMYRAGILKLDELVTQRYRLDRVNEGFQDMRDGLNIRGVIDFSL
jgi:S-(hydroxymethyl)glutathione dehydrogenase/alcohol dehydrogenase